MAPSTRSMLTAINTLLSPRDQAYPNILTLSPSEATVPDDMTTGGPSEALIAQDKSDMTTGGSSEALIAQDKLPDGPTLWDSLDSRLTTTDANNKAFQLYVISILDEMRSSINAPGNTTPLYAPTVHCPVTTPNVAPPVLGPVICANPTPVDAPLPPMRTSWFQDLPMTPDKFLNWSNLFFLKCLECELEPLCDRSAKSFVTTTANVRLNTRLYARLMQCLGPQNSFTDRLDIAGEGLQLMQKVKKVYGKPESHTFRMEQLAYFWNSLARHDKETIDDYYNRFNLVLSHLPMQGTNLPSDDVRRRFLLTLGGEFARFKQEDLDNRLETKYLDAPWEDLLDTLRDIAASYKLRSSHETIATASSMGYSLNAVTTSMEPALVNAVSSHTSDTAKIKALEDKLAILEKAKEKADAAANKKKSEAKAALANGPDFYCHTHGFGKNPLHTSGTCINRSPGHNEYATATDTMGGSTYKRK